jgi:predicted AlkP superfamily pyrophosphatase or phosphodiesterase
VDAFNAAGPMDRYAGRVWDLYQPADEYVNPDVREVEVPNELIGVTFPHSLEGLETTRLYAAISYTPFLDELTIEFARAAIENEALGMRGETDLILIGLSATDLIGHAFGPESREQEDNLLRLDSLLAGFFRFLDERFGEDSVLIALSADHGVDGNPGGKPPARLDPADVVDTARQALEARLGPGDYLLPMREAYLTFTPDLRDERPGDIRALQDAVAQALLRLDGVAFAVPAYKILEGSLDAGNPVMDRIARSYRPGLSGDIFVVPDAYRRVYSGAPRYSATHGTPYSYDTHVAMMFHGPGIPALTADRPAAPESIAPTIAALIGIDPPTAANAPVLAEIAPRPAQTIH